MTVLSAFLILAFLGIALGLFLSFADKKFSIEKNEKLASLESIMPGANCGGCGFAGCTAYAEAVFNGTAQPGLCSPGGQNLADKMAEIMGISVGVVEKKVAFVFCKNTCEKTKKDYKYYGIEDCNAASLLFKGDNACKFSCLHLGSCIKVCESNAISKDSSGNIVVNPELCVGCGKCQAVCPNGVIRLIPANARLVVACNSKDKGAEVRQKCDFGCIGCKICETKFPESGFKVNDNLAVADYSVYTEDSVKAMNACPRKIIVKR